MSDNPRRAKAGGLAVLALGLIVALPVLYVLSIGPVTGLCVRYLQESDPANPSPIDYFYRPLLWVYQNAPAPVGKALGWWIGLWVP
jgi:hypothetical protein